LNFARLPASLLDTSLLVLNIQENAVSKHNIPDNVKSKINLLKGAITFSKMEVGLHPTETPNAQ
jgi:hypothetical protein